MVEIPEHLLIRSAEARAKALGITVEQALAEMKGESAPTVVEKEPEVKVIDEKPAEPVVAEKPTVDPNAPKEVDFAPEVKVTQRLLTVVKAKPIQKSVAEPVDKVNTWPHLMVLVVFLHMSRVFYHGAYKAPREFNWVIGVILLLLTLLLSFTGYLLPWDQLAIWAVTVGGNMAGYTPVIGAQAKFGLFAGLEATTATLLRFYVLHVLFLPFIIVIFMAVHFWRVRKDGGISGPL